MADFNSIVEKTFKFEGGFQQFPNDTANYCGGKLIGTNHGISAVAYGQYLGRCPSVDEVKAITKDIAKNVYKKLFWDFIQGDIIKDQSLAHIVFDSHIASGGNGIIRSKKAINSVSPVFTKTDSSKFTVEQVNKINTLNSKQLFDKVKEGEIANRKYLAESNPSKYGMFLKGWLNRLDNIVYSGAEFTKKNIIPISISIIALGTIIYLIVANKQQIIS